MKRKAVYLEWVDAAAENGWDADDKVGGIDYCKALGFLIKEDKEQIIIAATVSEKESNARIAIPKVWIKKRKWIKI